MITQVEILTVLRGAVYTALLAALPMLGTALVIGVLVSIFQATTQINEQTLAFVPKIIGILLAVLVFGGWIISLVTEYTREVYGAINQMLA